MAGVRSEVVRSNRRNLETFSLLWLDAEVNKTEENRQAQRKLRQIINHLQTFDDQYQCEQYISCFSNQDRFILIVSGRLGRQIVPQIHHLRQLSAIYVYCNDKKLNGEWAKNYTKIKDVIIRLDVLINQMRSDHNNRENIDEPLPINIYTINGNEDYSTNDLNGGFVHSLLLIDVLLRMKSNHEDKRQLIEYCYIEYEGNNKELTNVEEFDHSYSSNDALWWYTRDSFIHKMLNKALRTQDIELLFLFRFLINDIYEQLKQYQCRSSMRVYRGQAISRDELEILRKSIKKLISINSFFSTSIDFDRAMSFLNNPKISNELVRILFIIDADPQVVTTRPFADISSYSAYKEKEVLFMIGCVFRLIDVQQNDQIWEIHMKLCGDNEHDMQNLFQHMKNEYAGGDQQVELRSFGTVLYKMGKYDLAEIVYRRVLNETSSNNPIFSSIYQSLGMIYEEKCEYDNSLEFYREALQAQRENDPSNYVRIGGIYCCIGVIYKKQGDFNRALDYYYDAIELFHKANDDNHRDVASLYNNIAIIYSNQKQYTEALDYYKKMLDIERKHLPANHSDLGMSYSNIGLVYYSLHKYDLAMSYFDQSLEIKLKSLPSDHPLIAKSYVNIGRVYEAQNDRKQALLYFQKAAAIRHKAFSSDHPDVIKIDKDIERIQSKFK